MPRTLTMHQASLAHIGERLAALGLDIEIVTFDDTGHFDIAAPGCRRQRQRRTTSGSRPTCRTGRRLSTTCSR